MSRSLFLFQPVIKTGTKYAKCFGFVFKLAAFILTGDNQTGRQVSHTNGTVSGVDSLSAVAGRMEHINAQIRGIKGELHFLRFRENGNRYGGSMNPAAAFSDRNTFDAMHSAFEFQAAEGFRTGKHQQGFIDTAQVRITD